LQSLPDEERQAKFREIGEQTAALASKLDEKYAPQIKSALKLEQFERLNQISRQTRGIQVFSDAEVIKVLELTPEQQDKLAGIRQEYEQKQRELFAGGGASDVRERFAKLREERDGKAAEVLTKGQAEKLAQLKGKPFDLAQLRGGTAGRRNEEKE
jgi:DNA-binding MarR family transcriptional regulator